MILKEICCLYEIKFGPEMEPLKHKLKKLQIYRTIKTIPTIEYVKYRNKVQKETSNFCPRNTNP